jgi:uncharacterized repeat protein (TIGR03803 family)
MRPPSSNEQSFHRIQRRNLNMTNLTESRGLLINKKSATLTLVSALAIACALTLFASSPAQAQTFSVIHAFAGYGDGEFPDAGVTLRGASLFGTASKGGDSQNPYGTVYQVSQVGSQWFTAPIYLFNNPNTNFTPQARVMFGPDGHLYSTTNAGFGTVFQLTPPLSLCKTANCFWTQKVLHQFTPFPDGYAPNRADITFDPQGNIYGTTQNGGSPDYGEGTVYQLQRSGNTWTENVLWSFGAPGDGANPAGGVIRDNDGNLFGTTTMGGLYGFGTVFELTYNQGTGWTETILYNFQNGSDGENPWAGLVMDQSGNLYGATTGGGSGRGGTVFELSPSGNTWAFNVLYSLPGVPGGGVEAALSMDAAGNLYGTAVWDGTHPFFGSVFKLAKTGNGWTYTSLHDFTGGPDGGNPISSVAIDTDGTLYGTTYQGGNFQGICSQNGCGTVWMIKP